MDVVGYLYKETIEGRVSRLMGFDLAGAVTKDRTQLLPTILVQPTWLKMAAYWEGTAVRDTSRNAVPDFDTAEEEGEDSEEAVDGDASSEETEVAGAGAEVIG